MSGQQTSAKDAGPARGTSEPWSSVATAALIAVPMIVVVLAMRSYSHLVRIRHIYVAGYLVHHLFQGVLLVIPASFVLAFRPRRRATVGLALVALGAGSGMILDEMTYMIMTPASDADYLSAVSLVGSVLFVLAGLATLLLAFLTLRVSRK